MPTLTQLAIKHKGRLRKIKKCRTKALKKAHQDFFEGRMLHQTTSAWNKDGKEISVDLRASFIQHKGKKALLFSLSEREV